MAQEDYEKGEVSEVGFVTVAGAAVGIQFLPRIGIWEAMWVSKDGRLGILGCQTLLRSTLEKDWDRVKWEKRYGRLGVRQHPPRLMTS